MDSKDSLDKLLKKWEPPNPLDQERFSKNVLFRLQKEPSKSLLEKMGKVVGEVVDAWLPAPEILVPVASLLIVFVNVQYFHGRQVAEREREVRQWHDGFSSPLGISTLAGAYENQPSKNWMHDHNN